MVEPATTQELREKILDDMCDLGKMCLDDKDVEQALHWLNLAASHGSDRANFELGKIYSYGDDLPEDMAKAAEYFEKSGDYLYDYFNEIYCNFGEMYRYGRGVEKNIEKAIFWYELEVSCGEDYDVSRDAKFALAEIYRDGEGGIKPDGEKAVNYFIDLALGLGDYFFVTDTRIYGDGQNVPMTDSERDYFYSFDTSNGDDKARFALGCMYLYGQAVKPNVYKAAWWFAKTDELDLIDTDMDATFDLAEKFRTGDGVEKDIDTAIAWYEKIIEYYPSDGKTLSALSALSEACFELAETYFNSGNIDKAIDLYQQADDKGNLKATHRLAEIYLNGTGVKKNLTEACYYLNKTVEGLLDKLEE